ncbi:NADP-dependent oxidoreductase [Pedobacter sp. L105]|uniref:NADP-dependent oxidoreductase n=1 Tax=Pedobacter sp. L105 TaxID=1641871 RepID=UPI00131D3D2A|nr:NADP-dependent oxidoreductase [Pedobacter sp. L105]
MNKVILFNHWPEGLPVATDFKFIEEEIPVPKEGEILLKTLYVSVDPYLRGRMKDVKSYIAPFKLGEPISSALITQVTKSSNDKFKEGDFFLGYLDWKEYQISTGAGLTRVDPDAASLSSYLGILGATGLTAYMGLKEIGLPKPGETVVVSGAAGAVGIAVGQIAKIMGCRVIGLAGSDEKVETLKSRFKYDEGINYKTTKDLTAAIKALCPEGVNIYFDNVGGEVSDAVLANLTYKSRIIVCGAIALYNDVEPALAPRVEWRLVVNSATMSGFLLSDFSDQIPAGIQQLTTWFKEGKIIQSETIVKGFDQIPSAFTGLFTGQNHGKMVVEI